MNFDSSTGKKVSLSKLFNQPVYSVFCDKGPSYNTVAKWSRWFREEREDIQDQSRPARPVTQTTTEHIEEVHCLIDDPHLTIDEIQVETGMSRGTIERIISDYL